MAKKPTQSLKDLLAQQQELAKQIAELQETERQEFKARVEAEAAALGLICSEIWGNVKRTKTSKASGKVVKLVNGASYKDPETGKVYVKGKTKGRLPAYLMNCTDPEEYRVAA